MDLKEKQTKWNIERPLFEAEFIHSHLLPFFNFNENTGDYEIKNEYENDADRQLAYDTLNTGWVMWLRAKRQIVPEGFVLVPKEPTEKMQSDFERGMFLSEFNFSDFECFEDGYKAMIESQEPSHD